MRRKRTTPLKDDQINLGSCSTELRARILSNAPYFRGLPQPAIDAVNGLFRSVSHPAGTALYHEGEPVQALFLVAHGTVKLLQHSVAGDKVVLDLLSQGDSFGGLSALRQGRYPHSAIAQTGCCVLTITTADFRHQMLSGFDAHVRRQQHRFQFFIQIFINLPTTKYASQGFSHLVA